MTDLHLRYINSGWDEIIHQRPCQKLTVLIVQRVFVQGRTDSLGHAALNLTVYDRGVDNRATVFNHNIAQQGDLAGIAVHFDQGDMGRVGMRGRWGFVMGRGVQTGFFIRRKAAGLHQYAVGQFLDRHQRGGIRLAPDHSLGQLQIIVRHLGQTRGDTQYLVA